MPVNWRFDQSIGEARACYVNSYFETGLYQPTVFE